MIRFSIGCFLLSMAAAPAAVTTSGNFGTGSPVPTLALTEDLSFFITDPSVQLN